MNKPLKILVVDDEPDVLEILSYNLSKANFSVVTASNGLDCIDLARSENPDLIILDVRMPKLTGIETCRLLRMEERFKNTPVFFLTADTDEYTTMNAFDAGGNHFLTKPIRPSILLEMIQELI